MNTLDRSAEPVHAVVWEADPRTLQLTYVSRGAETLFGYPLEHWIMRPSFWIDVLHPYDRERAYSECRAAVDACEDRELVYRIVRADGRIVWIRDLLRIICDGGGAPTGVRGVMLELSGQSSDPHAKKMETLGRFTEAIAHDLNNILTTIRGTTELAIASELSLGVRLELQEIAQVADSGSALLRQLLAYGHRPAGPVETVDVHLSIAGLRGIIDRLVGAGVRLELSVEPQVAPVRLAPGGLEQVMMNLAINARDAMPAGGRLSIASRIPEARPGHPPAPRYVEIHVIDTGMGMTLRTRERIFEPFFTTKGPGRGTGLGLATVHSIISEAGGQIDVDTEIGRGTRFTIRLPLAE